MTILRRAAPRGGTWATCLVSAMLLICARRAAAAEASLTTTDKAKECLRLCNPDSFRCNEGMVLCLIKVAHASVAVDAAHKVLKNRPDRPAYQRLLAYAYLAAGQPEAAKKRLNATLAERPRDCPSYSMLAWVHFRQKRPQLAAKVLARNETCPREPAERSRWALMRAYVAFLKGDIWTTQRRLVEGESAGVVYPEDVLLWERMLRRARPNRHAPLQLNLDLAAGGTTNARGAVPLASVPDATSTGQLQLSLSGTAMGPSRWFVRPRLEGAVVMSMLENFGEVDVSDANSYLLTARPGILLDLGLSTFDLSYRGTLVMLKAPSPATGVSPTVATESHRAELDLMLPHGFTLLSGFGRSLAIQRSRSRWDYNGGAGWRHLFQNGHMVALAASFFINNADIDLYEQYGGTLAGNYGFPITRGFTCQLRFNWIQNYFPNNPRGGGNSTLLQAGAALWLNVAKTTQLGLRYSFGHAFGTTNAIPEYTTHGVLMAARWNLSWNPWAPDIRSPDGHVNIDYQLDEKAAYGRDVRVQDLLRRTSVPQQSM